MHANEEDEREQDGPEDRGELLQRQNTDQEPVMVSTTIRPRGTVQRGSAAAPGSVTA
jgi:hypothetical protein